MYSYITVLTKYEFHTIGILVHIVAWYVIKNQSGCSTITQSNTACDPFH